MKGRSLYKPDRGQFLPIVALFVLVMPLLQGCVASPDRHPLAEDRYSDALVLGRSNLRFWGDEAYPLGAGLEDPSYEELQEVFPGLTGQELHFLAISGGGENGAFGAGLLNGWTASGTRPRFNVVTGISAGALIAPFAYLGPAYDHVIEQLYTQHSTDDLLQKRHLFRAVWADARYDTSPLRELLAEYIDEDVVAAIATEHQRGRLLFIGTTNLDAGRAVNWDIGAIASSGEPGALDLILDIILASVSIPVVFPPVTIDVEVDGHSYDELHVDGGVSRQAFLFDLGAEADTFETLRVVGRGNAYIIRNSKLSASWQAVDRRIFSIAQRSANSMVRTQGIGDLYREYLGALKYDFVFNLAYIPGSFKADSHELFDRDYMRHLYKLGHEMALNGSAWVDTPPGLQPR